MKEHFMRKYGTKRIRTVLANHNTVIWFRLVARFIRFFNTRIIDWLMIYWWFIHSWHEEQAFGKIIQALDTSRSVELKSVRILYKLSTFLSLWQSGGGWRNRLEAKLFHWPDCWYKDIIVFGRDFLRAAQMRLCFHANTKGLSTTRHQHAGHKFNRPLHWW